MTVVALIGTRRISKYPCPQIILAVPDRRSPIGDRMGDLAVHVASRASLGLLGAPPDAEQVAAVAVLAEIRIAAV